MKKVLFFLLFLWILAGCAPAGLEETPVVSTLTPLEHARVRLTAFLDALSQGQYDRAAEDFNGDLTVLRGYNPDVEPDDTVGLLKNACEFNGFQCLPLRAILTEEALSETHFRFTVLFVDENGEVFELGPCCGEDGGEPVRAFTFEVVLEADSYQVISLPPYMP